MDICHIDIRQDVFDHWCSIGISHGLPSDTDIASFLIQQYEHHPGAHSPSVCVNCKLPLTLYCAKCNLLSQHGQPAQETTGAVFAMTSSSELEDSRISVGQSKDCGIICIKEEKVESINEHKEIDENQVEVLSEHVIRCQSRDSKKSFSHSLPPTRHKRKNSAQAVSKIPKERTDATSSHDLFMPGTGIIKPSKDCQKKVSSHEKVKSHVCQECQKAFSEPYNLKRHMRKHTGEKPYICEECGAAFKDSGNRKVHMRLHTGEKPYVCEECGIAFTQLSSYKSHMRTHTGEKPYVCKDCGAAFKHSSPFSIHKRSHTGEKPYVCSECGAAFLRSDDCKAHMRTHTGERPYVCKDCGAAFSRQSHRKAHMRSHTGERPYLCEECGAAFTQAHTLRNHILTHSNEKPYICHMCGATFSSAILLKKHIETHKVHL